MACGGDTRLQNISDWNNTRTTGTPQVNSALAAADGTVNSYLRKQYSVPLSPVYVLQPVIEVSARIAKYRLMSARGLVDQQTRTDYEDDMKWLQGVAAGTITLGIDPDAAPSSARIDSSTPRSSLKEVSRMKLWGFK